jgi:hypothetical protein
MYDIIGDVHGHATLLIKLLKASGYKNRRTGYVHTDRKAIFVGDFINVGPEIRQTLQIIRRMTEEGNAFTILGNHELNAILFSLKDENKLPLLKKESNRSLSMAQTILEFKDYPEEWKDYLKWLRKLPLFFEEDGIRVVHACWNDMNIQIIKNELPSGKKPKRIFRNLVLDVRSPLSQSILQTTRGIHHILPPDIRLYDNYRRNHHFYRIKWWTDPAGMTFQQFSFESKFKLPDYTIPPQILPETEPYPSEAPPVFFGHYCQRNGPFIIRDNVCCVDACVRSKKKLVMYRWDGEKVLDPEKLRFIKPGN